jgi:uncharacterized protein YdeI (YjbR/CyaY-like superfamily)
MQLNLLKIEVKSLKELRTWLKKNHSQTESIWLVTYKKSVPDYFINYSDIVDEALCFGWIDSLPRALDENRTMLRLSPRKKGSAWSKINRDKVIRLISEDRMTKAGLDVINRSKKDGSWDALKQIDGNTVPLDLMKAFRSYQDALKNYKKFPPSSQRSILEWITLAKTPVTRQKRIQETARLAGDNIRANHYRQPLKKK